MDEIEQALQDAESEELNRLIQKGVKFSLTYKVTRRGGLLRRRPTEVTEDFTIQEPTLSTLDRLSELWIDIALDEDVFSNGGASALAEAKRVTKENAYKAAAMIALAVLGEDYFIAEEGKGGRTRYREDKKELKRLTSLFFHSIKPSKLIQLATMITNVSNLGDFIGSMRLMSGARTTQPKKGRIE